MARRETALVVLISFLFWTLGCATKTRVQAAGEYIADPPSRGQVVRVAAVLTKSGEKVDFPKENPALLTPDRVVCLAKGARLITVDRWSGVMTRGTDVVGVHTRNRYYKDPLVITETSDSVTFVAADTPLEREIPLAEVDQLWVQRKGLTAAGVVMTVLIVVGVLYGLLGLAVWVGSE